MTGYMERKDLGNEEIPAERAGQIRDGVSRVMERIAAAEAAAGRAAGSVTLLAATKTRDVGEIMAALDAGVRMIGENRPQEVVAKAEGLSRLAADRGWRLGVSQSASAGAGAGAVEPSGLQDAATVIPFHLIGQLQSNKIGKMLPLVNTIESVDSIELAEKISRRAVAAGITVGVLLEVNESGEPTKSGCEPSHAIDLAQRIGAMGGLDLQGLMTVGKHVDDEAAVRAGFAHLRAVRDHILAAHTPGTEHCAELSMGMTGDMELAIAEGATIVRVGTAIFGERDYK